MTARERASEIQPKHNLYCADHLHGKLMSSSTNKRQPKMITGPNPVTQIEQHSQVGAAKEGRAPAGEHVKEGDEALGGVGGEVVGVGRQVGERCQRVGVQVHVAQLGQVEVRRAQQQHHQQAACTCRGKLHHLDQSNQNLGKSSSHFPEYLEERRSFPAACACHGGCTNSRSFKS